jgi:hypothetical protein
MRIRLMMRFGGKSATTSGMFLTAATTNPKPWLPMLGSLVAHGALLALVPLTADYLAQYYVDDLDWAAYHVEPLRVRTMPELVYYSADRESRRRGKGGGTSSTSSGDLAGGPSATARVPGAKSLELPPLKPSKASVVILQPDTPTQAKEPPPKFPALAFWARRNAVTPIPRRDHIVTPGRTEDAGPPPAMAAPPVLAVSNFNTRAGDRNIAVAPPVPVPSLSVSSSATAPIRDRTSDPVSGVFDSFPGEGLNLITISAEQIRPGEVVTPPPGSQSDRRAERVAGAGGGTTSWPSAAGGKGGVAPQRGSGIHDDSLTGDLPARGAEAFTRIMHPRGGQFDTVVTQSGAQYDGRRVVGGLGGSPVYTVFLHVGDESEWALDFCLPPFANSSIGAHEVYVEASTPLSPPYPIATVVPNSVMGEARSTAIVFHGLLTAAGNFRDIQAIERGITAEKIAAEKIASVLDQWRFRPATKNNVAVDVEVLLRTPVLY